MILFFAFSKIAARVSAAFKSASSRPLESTKASFVFLMGRPGLPNPAPEPFERWLASSAHPVALRRNPSGAPFPAPANPSPKIRSAASGPASAKPSRYGLLPATTCPRARRAVLCQAPRPASTPKRPRPRYGEALSITKSAFAFSAPRLFRGRCTAGGGFPQSLGLCAKRPACGQRASFFRAQSQIGGLLSQKIFPSILIQLFQSNP